MTDLKRTPLYDLHLSLGAKMVPFAGYEMPVQYGLGVMKEHLWTRERAGLFDVSHMGQVRIDGPDWETIALAFETLVPQDVLGLKGGRQRYGFFTNKDGGIEDDLMFARGLDNVSGQDFLFVVVNAACKEADTHRMKSLEPVVTVTPITDRALIALQGPSAEEAFRQVVPAAADDMRFLDWELWDGDELWVSRSGYTGEDGFEISLPATRAEAFVEQLLDMDDVQAIGLGARDSLRLEAGLCLYGNDIDATTTPVEAALTWGIQKARKAGGDRAGGFPGADVILGQLANGAPRKRVGLLPEGRAPMRDGTLLFSGDEQVGSVTSGAFGPTIERPMSMGYVDPKYSEIGTKLEGEVRGKRMPVTIADMPFTPANFKR